MLCKPQNHISAIHDFMIDKNTEIINEIYGSGVIPVNLSL